MEQELLNKISKDLEFVKQKVIIMDNELEDISNDLHKVRPSYLEKLKKIKKGKFHSFDTKKEFLDFVENEI